MPRPLTDQSYCSWCGAQISFKGWSAACGECGFRHYINPKPANSVIVSRGGKVMMVQRAQPPFVGKYDFPGGFMDADDPSMEAAAYRELWEEVGLSKEQLGPLTYQGSALTHYAWDDADLLGAGFFYHCPLKDEQLEIVVDPKENSQVRWVGKDELDEVDFAWDVDKQMLTEYFERLS